MKLFILENKVTVNDGSCVKRYSLRSLETKKSGETLVTEDNSPTHRCEMTLAPRFLPVSKVAN